MTKRRFVGKRNILDSEGNLSPIPQSSTSQTSDYTDTAIQAPNMHVENSYTYSFISSIMMSCTPAIQNIGTYHNNFQILKMKNQNQFLNPSLLLKKKCCTYDS
jgi:hypothetical protein